MLGIRAKQQKTILVIELSGTFSIKQIEQFNNAITHELVKGRTAVAMSFARVDYVDSSAIGTMIKMMNMISHSGGELIIYDASESVFSVLKVSKLDKFFSVTNSRSLSVRFPEVDFSFT
jgi:anti-sigma B factor antagonist